MPVFGAQHYMSLHHVHVKVWKKNHPTAVMSATFVIGMFFLYQVTPTIPYNPTVQRPSAFPLCSLAGSLSSSGASSSRCCSQPSTPSSTSRGRWEWARPCLVFNYFTSYLSQTLVVKGPFWKKKKEIELEPTEVDRYIQAYRVFKKTGILVEVVVTSLKSIRK